MNEIKKVKREHLEYLDKELFSIMIKCPEPLHERVENLIKYVHENIIQRNREMVNEIKVAVYQKIKSAETEEEKEEWYQYYKSLNDLL